MRFGSICLASLLRRQKYIVRNRGVIAHNLERLRRT